MEEATGEILDRIYVIGRALFRRAIFGRASAVKPPDFSRPSFPTPSSYTAVPRNIPAAAANRVFTHTAGRCCRRGTSDGVSVYQMNPCPVFVLPP